MKEHLILARTTRRVLTASHRVPRHIDKDERVFVNAWSARSHTYFARAYTVDGLCIVLARSEYRIGG